MKLFITVCRLLIFGTDTVDGYTNLMTREYVFNETNLVI